MFLLNDIKSYNSVSISLCSHLGFMNNPHVLTLRVKIVILCSRLVDGFLFVFVLGVLDGCGWSDAGGDQGSPG